MKKSILLTLIVLALGCLQAQDLTFWQNVRHSSYTAQDSMLIRCETVSDTLGSTQICYSTAQGFVNKTLERVSGLTYQAWIPTDNTQEQVLHFKGIQSSLPDSLAALMPFSFEYTFASSAYLSSTTFPANFNKLGEISADSLGEISQTYLDLNKLYFGANDTKFVVGLTNNGTSFPTMSGMSFNIYMVALVNPETVFIDSTVFAFVYANVPVFISSGLYKMHGIDLTSLTRICDIQTNVSGNKLQMGVDISNLANDPDFGVWPSYSNSLILFPLTQQMSLGQTSLIPNDIGVASLVQIKNDFIPAYTNQLPQILDYSFSTVVNNTTINALYNDLDGNFPLVAEVVVNGNTYTLLHSSFDYSTSVSFAGNFTEPGWQTATLRFSDNLSDYTEQTVTSTGNEDNIIPATPSLNIYPNPFNSANGNLNLSYQAKQTDFVTVDIYNVRGQKVNTIFKNNLSSGTHTFTWNGTDSKGTQLSAGIYFFNISTSAGMKGRKIILLK